ncbi:MAG: GIY-YIG nuclease family protein [Lachnospiraceae bacterium]|nr:GIY-YIG nuclease family protein [Lachnospiraceae bacterium]
MNYLYMIRCEDRSIYTGITKDLYHRMDAHYYGKKEGAKYTKSRKPEQLCMVWTVDSWSDACRLEHFVKSLTKKKKEEIIRNPSILEAKIHEARRDCGIVCQILGKQQNYPLFLKDYLSNCEKI